MEFELPASGFTFPLGNKDVFVITDRKRKTEKLASLILRKLFLPENPDTIAEVLYWMRKAVLDCKIFPETHRCMWEIHGDGFGGRGSFCEDGNTLIIYI